MRTNIIILFSLLILGLFLSSAFAQPSRTTISIINLTPGGGITADEAVLLTDRLLVELARTTRFEVTERSRRDEILKEQAFQQTGLCDEASCLAKVGKLLGVQKMVGGSVGRLGKTYSVSLRMVDVETGSIEQTAVKDYPGNVDYLLTTAMKDVAWQLARGGLTPAEQRELARRKKEEERLEAKRRKEEERLAALRAPFVAESLKVEVQKKHVADSLAAIERAKEEARLAKEREEKRKRDVELARLSEQKRREAKLRAAAHSRSRRRMVGWVSFTLGSLSTVGAVLRGQQANSLFNKYKSATDPAVVDKYEKDVKSADSQTNILIGTSGAFYLTSGIFFLSSRGSGNGVVEGPSRSINIGLGKGFKPGAELVMRF